MLAAPADPGPHWSDADLYYSDFSNAGGLNTPPPGMGLTVSTGTVTFPTGGGFMGSSRVMDCNFPSNAGDGGGRGDVTFPHRTDLWVMTAVQILVKPSTGNKDQKTNILRNDAGGGSNTGFSLQFNQADGSWIIATLDNDGTNHNLTLTYDTGNWRLSKINVNTNAPGSVKRTRAWFDGNNGAPDFDLSTTGAVGRDISDVSFGGTLNGGSGASHFLFGMVAVASFDPGWP